MTLTDDDRLWRDQNIPNMSDEDLEKIIDTFGGNGEGKKEQQQHQQEQKQQGQGRPETLSVSQALRRNSGEFLVKGTITGMKPLFKMISSYETCCNNCGNVVKISLPEPIFSVKPRNPCIQCSENSLIVQNKDHFSVVAIELQDSDTFNDLERLPVFLFNNDTENIRVGEAVTIDGKIHINESKVKKLFPCFYAKSIKYDESTELVLTSQDVDAIKRFVEYTKRKDLNVIDELVKMYDRQIIGCELPKKGFLLSAVNSIGDEKRKYLDNSRRNRIHSLLVGPLGLAKTAMLKAAVRLVPNSRYESAGGNASGRSLTAIVTKEEENHILRIGPAPLAKNHLCGLNEFGRMDYEDQKH
jgi:DNA replicative helicase MCM subunit Mcm2 (Cdc46/Mcm family)